MRPSIVGDAAAVSVGRRVGLGVSVGGMLVGVGLAASVCAIIVNAATCAVCWISSGLIVGGAGGAQALTAKTNTTPAINAFRLIYYFISLSFRWSGAAYLMTTLSLNRVIVSSSSPCSLKFPTIFLPPTQAT